jgi:hypothetical protein
MDSRFQAISAVYNGLIKAVLQFPNLEKLSLHNGFKDIRPEVLSVAETESRERWLHAARTIRAITPRGDASAPLSATAMDVNKLPVRKKSLNSGTTVHSTRTMVLRYWR